MEKEAKIVGKEEHEQSSKDIKEFLKYKFPIILCPILTILGAILIVLYL